jgi:hypothetical protein
VATELRTMGIPWDHERSPMWCVNALKPSRTTVVFEWLSMRFSSADR